MTTKTLPTHIGGYQHLEPDVIAKEGDIYVRFGIPADFVTGEGLGQTVQRLKYLTGYNIYRRIPVAKQSDAHEREMAGKAAQLHTAAVVSLPGVSGNFVGLPTDAKARKATPIYSGFLKYFPLAIAEVARVSQAGNDQHNPGQPLHWDRSKSGDELDAAARHLLEAGKFDTDGQRHSAKHAWRAMANLQKELEAEAQ